MNLELKLKTETAFLICPKCHKPIERKDRNYTYNNCISFYRIYDNITSFVPESFREDSIATGK